MQDDEDDLELPDRLKPVVGPVIDEMLGPGIINISQELGTRLPERMVYTRINHHFAHAGLGYRPVSHDTFRLAVRSRKYPLFGKFDGRVHIIPKVPFRDEHFAVPTYAIEGLLLYHISVLWFIAVLSFFFLLGYLTHAGFWLGVCIEVFGSAIVLYITYQLGRNEHEEAEERIEASFLFLRSTLQNIR